MTLPNRFLYLVLVGTLPLLGLGCSSENSLETGYFASSNPEKGNIPLVAILQTDESTHAYHWLQVKCSDSHEVAEFVEGGSADSEANSLPGLNLLHVNSSESCVSSEIRATSESDRIEVVVNNSSPRELQRVSKNEFLRILREVFDRFVKQSKSKSLWPSYDDYLSQGFSDSQEKVCSLALNMSCSEVFRLDASGASNDSDVVNRLLDEAAKEAERALESLSDRNASDTLNVNEPPEQPVSKNREIEWSPGDWVLYSIDIEAGKQASSNSTSTKLGGRIIYDGTKDGTISWTKKEGIGPNQTNFALRSYLPFRFSSEEEGGLTDVEFLRFDLSLTNSSQRFRHSEVFGERDIETKEELEKAAGGSVYYWDGPDRIYLRLSEENANGLYQKVRAIYKRATE